MHSQNKSIESWVFVEDCLQMINNGGKKVRQDQIIKNAPIDAEIWRMVMESSLSSGIQGGNW